VGSQHLNLADLARCRRSASELLRIAK
jgi:hypothetical protein